jgi:transcriptional regulator with XRE-family HTH domain
MHTADFGGENVNRLRELRRARGLSQDELATVTGLWQGTISRMETGHTPAPSTIRKLTEYFQVPGEWLMGLDVPSGGIHNVSDPRVARRTEAAAQGAAASM